MRALARLDRESNVHLLVSVVVSMPRIDLRIEVAVFDQQLADIFHRRRNLRHVEGIAQLQPGSVYDLARVRRFREILGRAHLPDEPAVLRDELDGDAAVHGCGVDLNVLIAARGV